MSSSDTPSRGHDLLSLFASTHRAGRLGRGCWLRRPRVRSRLRWDAAVKGFDCDRTVTITALTLAHVLRTLSRRPAVSAEMTLSTPRSKCLGSWPHCRPSSSPWDVELMALECTLTSRPIRQAVVVSNVRAWGALACGPYLPGKCSVRTLGPGSSCDRLHCVRRLQLIFRSPHKQRPSASMLQATCMLACALRLTLFQACVCLQNVASVTWSWTLARVANEWTARRRAVSLPATSFCMPGAGAGGSTSRSAAKFHCASSTGCSAAQHDCRQVEQHMSVPRNRLV